VVLLNQSVLLARVNDDADTLIGLSERLLECGVLPYYLHQLDRVTGSHHFEVPVEKGRSLIEELRCRLPGYLVPRYVTERPGSAAKIVLA
jgi:L-lysine 2,3-aminomutase